MNSWVVLKDQLQNNLSTWWTARKLQKSLKSSKEVTKDAIKFLVCYVLILIIVPSSAVMCRVPVCLFLAKVRCPWRTCMYVCNVCMYVLSNMWLLYFSSEQSAWVGAHDDPRPQPRPEFQPLPSAGGGLPALGRPGQRGHQEGERIYGKNSPEPYISYSVCSSLNYLF